MNHFVFITLEWAISFYIHRRSPYMLSRHFAPACFYSSPKRTNCSTECISSLCWSSLLMFLEAACIVTILNTHEEVVVVVIWLIRRRDRSLLEVRRNLIALQATLCCLRRRNLCPVFATVASLCASKERSERWSEQLVAIRNLTTRCR